MTNADVQFSNQYVRPLAEAMARHYFFAKNVIALWNARGGSAAIPNDGTVVPDGAPGDGRPGITGANVNNIINRALETVADYEAASNAKLNTILQVAVNTRS